MERAVIGTNILFYISQFISEYSRKDVSHREEFAHPGDTDYSESSVGSSMGKTPCRYGASCYRYDYFGLVCDEVVVIFDKII